ncbi:hypothetical protein RUM44_004914 [Polyplax serrata]|uniref:Uncharacterized protein n=1 Tax=Polyplax serrata TaxID=468196 RepID=A0ABR1B4M9_POLSC
MARLIYILGRNRRRKTHSEFKFDNFSYNFEPPTIRIEEYTTPSLYSVKKYSPVPESEFKHWTVLTEGFPPGITVDELKKYGRRRQPAHMIPQDNLRLEEGSLKPYISEYTRRFQAYGPLDLQPLQNKTNKENYNQISYQVPPLAKSTYKTEQEKRPVLKRPPVVLEPLKKSLAELNAGKQSECLIRPYCDKRKLLRRSTALKPEGIMTDETEVRKEYRAYLNPERAHIIRRLPSLRMEGEFEPFTTEHQDKYVAYLLGKRPMLQKKKTLLKMEGDFNFLTENDLSYVPHQPSERPRLRKRSTSLKLDGELEFFPEYRESFIDYSRTRPITYKPCGTLRNDGELEKETETRRQFVNYDNVQVLESAKPENNLHVEGEMDIVPEYKQNYVDFPRERPLMRKPLNQIKPDGNLQVLNDGSTRYGAELMTNQEKVNGSNDNLVHTGMSSNVSEQNDKFKKYESPEKTELIKMAPNLKLEGEMNFITEKADKFGVLVGERAEKRPSSLKLDNEFLVVPEYNKSNLNFRSFNAPLKPVRNFRSNPTSPRKKPKERIKFNLEEDKKFILGTPSRRRPMEKNLKFDLPLVSPSKMKEKLERRRDVEFDLGGNLRNSSIDGHYVRRLGTDPCLAVPKRNQAFHVLDVKGQLGCQAMRRDVLDSTSEDDTSTYRLEVSNPETGNVSHLRDLRLFPPPTLTTHGSLREEGEKRARKRAETFEKVVKGPEIANYLLEENNNIVDNSWKTPGKLSPMLPVENNNKRAFVVLNGTREGEQQTKETVQNLKGDWEALPDWMSSSPIV